MRLVPDWYRVPLASRSRRSANQPLLMSAVQHPAVVAVQRVVIATQSIALPRDGPERFAVFPENRSWRRTPIDGCFESSVAGFDWLPPACRGISDAQASFGTEAPAEIRGLFWPLSGHSEWIDWYFSDPWFLVPRVSVVGRALP